MKRKFLSMFMTLMFLSIAALGCRHSECRQMQRCCEASVDVEGVGHTCGAMSKDVRDPTTCRTITRTLRYMLEDKGEKIPEACGGAG